MIAQDRLEYRAYHISIQTLDGCPPDLASPPGAPYSPPAPFQWPPGARRASLGRGGEADKGPADLGTAPKEKSPKGQQSPCHAPAGPAKGETTHAYMVSTS
jgi:hypothetical protein